MIKQVKLTRFKKYKDATFHIHTQGITLLVGGNNSGKSTLIHALAVWEFCKMVLEHEKGRKVFNECELGSGEGFGMSAEDFLPIAVPTLNHLWTNLKTQLSPQEKENWSDDFPGYIMRIECTWEKENEDKHLEIGLSLVNDRLFIRVTNSNIIEGDILPKIVYLPTFAGVLPKENKATPAERRALLGRGMAGSIIRNMIYDLYETDEEIKRSILNEKTRFTKEEKVKYEETSPLQLLQKNIKNTFHSQLEVIPFSETYHTFIRVNERKVILNENGDLEVLPKSKYTPRDIITQGSGYLQWLSIFCILYSSNIDVLLLDEPDAHLHATLQSNLLSQLIQNSEGPNPKQILISTHSVEMIKQASLNLVFSMDKKDYLSTEESRVGVLNGIGSEYFPQLDLLQRHKKLIFIENDSDRKIISILGEKCGLALPDDVVYWATTDNHSDRRRLFDELKTIIPELKCVSLRDRDMININEIGPGLGYKGIPLPTESPIILLTWRRKNIESYLICPKAISIASGKRIADIKQYIADTFAIAVGDDGFNEAIPPEPIITLDGKHMFNDRSKGFETKFGVDKYAVANNMTAEEVCEDIKTFITRVNDLFNG